MVRFFAVQLFHLGRNIFKSSFDFAEIFKYWKASRSHWHDIVVSLMIVKTTLGFCIRLLFEDTVRMLEKKSAFIVNFVPFFVNKIGQTCDVSETLPSEHFLTVDIVVLLYKIIKNSSSYTVKCVSYAENSFICLSQNICLEQKRPHHFAVISLRFPLISKTNMMETFSLSLKKLPQSSTSFQFFSGCKY